MLCPVIVGRDRELGALLEALEGSAEGAGQVTFLVGEAGIGKSRLAAAVTGAAQSRGMTVLRGRAVRSGGTLPYRPWAEAFLSVLRDSELPATPELAPFRGALARLVPSWRSGDEPSGSESVVALGEGALRLLRTVGDPRGSVVVLEDLHWADPDSVALVEYLSDKLAGERVLLLATTRTEEGGLALGLAHTLRARREALVLELGRLAEEAVGAMARACLGANDPPAGVEDLLVNYADGVPFFVEELLASLVDTGALNRCEGTWKAERVLRPSVPLSFADSLRQRLDSLPGEAGRLLAVAALLGRHFDWSLLPAVSGIDEEVVLEHLRQASAVQLVEEDRLKARFRFRHSLSRDMCLALLLGPERSALARRVLTVVEEHHPSLPGEWCEIAAELAGEAGDHVRAAELLTEAGRRALHRGALATAAATSERALEAAGDHDSAAIEATEVLVEALTLGGEPERVAQLGAWLLARLAASGAPARRRARLHLQLATSAAAATDWQEARAHLDAARHLCPAKSDFELAARLSVLSAEVALGEHRPQEAARSAEAALAVAREHGPATVVCEALEVLGRVARLRRWQDAEAYFSEALDVAETLDLPLWRLRALGELGIQDVFVAGSPDRLESARRSAEQAGALVLAAQADLHLAVIHHLHHNLEDAFAALDRAEAASRRYGLGLLLPAVLANRALFESSRGQDREAERAADEALALGAGDPQVEANVRGLARTVLALAREDRGGARTELERALAIMPPLSDAASAPFRDMLLLLVTLDGDLTPELDRDLAPSDRSRHLLGKGFFEAARAVEAGRVGDRARAASAFARADAHLAPMPGFRHIVRRLLAEPALEDGWGDPVTWLREAITFFEGTGMKRSAEACRSLLRSAGASVPRRRAGAQSLPAPLVARGITPREADVLVLVAEGLTNRVIAKRLYLSVRTVEKHVERLLAKTDTSSRAQLAALVTRLLANGT